MVVFLKTLETWQHCYVNYGSEVHSKQNTRFYRISYHCFVIAIFINFVTSTYDCIISVFAQEPLVCRTAAFRRQCIVPQFSKPGAHLPDAQWARTATLRRRQRVRGSAPATPPPLLSAGSVDGSWDVLGQHHHAPIEEPESIRSPLRQPCGSCAIAHCGRSFLPQQRQRPGRWRQCRFHPQASTKVLRSDLGRHAQRLQYIAHFFRSASNPS